MNDPIKYAIWLSKNCGLTFTECYVYENKFYYIDSEVDMRALYNKYLKDNE
jgi:hypothetical protein